MNDYLTAPPRAFRRAIPCPGRNTRAHVSLRKNFMLQPSGATESVIDSRILPELRRITAPQHHALKIRFRWPRLTWFQTRLRKIVDAILRHPLRARSAAPYGAGIVRGASRFRRSPKKLRLGCGSRGFWSFNRRRTSLHRLAATPDSPASPWMSLRPGRQHTRGPVHGP